MNNLPININNAAPAQASPKQQGTDNANPQEERGFSDVLARQVNDSDKQSPSSRSPQDKDKPAEKQGSTENTPEAETLPAAVSADMLATLLQTQTATTQAEVYPQLVPDAPEVNAGTGKVIADLHGKPAGVHVAADLNNGDKTITGLFSGTASTKPEFAIAGKNLLADNAKTAAIKEAANDISLLTQRGNLNGELPPSIQQTGALLTATATPASSSSPAVISTPLTQPAWGDEFGQKITWMATQRNQSAELHLNPPQLGPLDVTLKMNGDQATALFTSPHAAVREAIEQALPRLREMLADNGIMLNNAMVSDQTAKNNQDTIPRKSSGKTLADAEGNSAEIQGVQEIRASSIRRHNGMVDTFA